MRLRRWILYGATICSFCVFLLCAFGIVSYGVQSNQSGIDLAGVFVTNTWTGQTWALTPREAEQLEKNSLYIAMIVGSLSAILPLIAAIRLARSLRAKSVARARRLDGLCPVCGYDVRESPGRCPECGEVTAT